MRDGFLALLAEGINSHAAAVALAAPDIAHNGAFVLVKIAPNQGIIAAVDGVVEELLGECGLRGFVLGDNHQAGGVLVDAVYEIADAVFDVLLRLLEMIGQAVQQSAGEVAVGWVYH